MNETSDKILIVDDEPSIRTVLSRWPEKEGYECRMAADVDEACTILEEESFSLIILDLMMPGQSGEVLLRTVTEQYPDIAVVMATGIDSRDTVLELLRLGAFGYVIKPLEQREILILVQFLIGPRFPPSGFMVKEMSRCRHRKVPRSWRNLKCGARIFQ